MSGKTITVAVFVHAAVFGAVLYFLQGAYAYEGFQMYAGRPSVPTGPYGMQYTPPAMQPSAMQLSAMQPSAMLQPPRVTGTPVPLGSTTAAMPQMTVAPAAMANSPASVLNTVPATQALASIPGQTMYGQMQQGPVNNVSVLQASQQSDKMQNCINSAQQQQQRCMQTATEQKKNDYTAFLAMNQAQISTNPMNPTLKRDLQAIQDRFTAATKACVDSENVAESICMSTPQ